MATRIISGLHDGSIVVRQSGETYNFDKSAVVLSSHVDGSNVEMTVGAIMDGIPHHKSNHTIFDIDGDIIGYAAGIFVQGSDDTINIGKTGLVEGATGITAGAAHLENKGAIIGAAQAVTFLGSSIIDNDGRIEGLGAIFVGGSTHISNGVSGVIRSVVTGIDCTTVAGHTTFINHGLLQSTGGYSSFAAGLESVDIVNDGVIKGDISLSNSADTIDNRGGKVVGTVAGREGNDTLITDSDKVHLFEEFNQGTDTVKSTVSYTLSENVERLVLIGTASINGTGVDAANDVLVGNGGDNTLSGLGGKDRLDGAKGNDSLWGGGGADTFHFSQGGGHDTFGDFSQGDMDKIDLSRWSGMTSLVAVTGHAQDQGTDVLIELGQDSLLIMNIQENQLSDADFIYASN